MLIFHLRLLPLLIQAELKYSIQLCKITCLGFTFLLSLFLPIIMLVKVQSRMVYYAGLVCFTFILGVGICFNLILLERVFNPLMYNVPKWSDTL